MGDGKKSSKRPSRDHAGISQFLDSMSAYTTFPVVGSFDGSKRVKKFADWDRRIRTVDVVRGYSAFEPSASNAFLLTLVILTLLFGSSALTLLMDIFERIVLRIEWDIIWRGMVLGGAFVLYFMRKKSPVWLMDFATFKAPPEQRMTRAQCVEVLRRYRAAAALAPQGRGWVYWSRADGEASCYHGLHFKVAN
jgi:hypothetical protein